MMYKENDHEHETLQLITRTRHANSLQTYEANSGPAWSVLSYDGAVLSRGLTLQWIIILGALQHMG